MIKDEYKNLVIFFSTGFYYFSKLLQELSFSARLEIDCLDFWHIRGIEFFSQIEELKNKDNEIYLTVIVL
ncbi:MAG: hypothetical protein V1915_02225 [Candidatus Bathyarchaeota archaeon]